MEAPQTKPLVPAGTVVDRWITATSRSKTAACVVINEKTHALYGASGAMDRSRLWRIMVGEVTPSLREAVAIRAASGCPVDLWALPVHGATEAA